MLGIRDCVPLIYYSFTMTKVEHFRRGNLDESCSSLVSLSLHRAQRGETTSRH